MVTIRDVAERANVGITSVSKYLNGGNLRPGYAERIREAIDALQYIPNDAARRLRISKQKACRRTGLVGILLPTLRFDFFNNTVSRICELLSEEGFDTLINNYSYDSGNAVRALRLLIQHDVDGLIVVPQDITIDEWQDIPEISNGTLPLVLLSRTITGISNDLIHSNDEEICFKATNHLISKGHRRIAIISSEISSLQDRINGYTSALKLSGIPVSDDYICVRDASDVSGYYNCLRLIDMQERPTALIAASYELTVGVMTALRENNLSIPEDISVIGYDNPILQEHFSPPLTIVVQPIEDYAAQAVQLLLRRINGDRNDYPTSICIDSWLMHGESVAEI